MSTLDNKFSTVVALVCNKAYIPRAFETIKDIRKIGQYTGPIILIGGNDWKPEDILYYTSEETLGLTGEIICEHFPDLDTDKIIQYRYQHMCREYQSAHITRPFQNHKLYLFHPRMKKYGTIFYIDIGMKIYRPIQPFFDLPSVKDSLIAHSDCYPYQNGWNLYNQFAISGYPQLGQELLKEFKNLYRDYFQTTTMIYDTNIITEERWNDILRLFYKYPFAITNDQAILALYFTEEKGWKKMDPSMYDYMKRSNNIDYIMTKI